jgi:protein-L-isoaspartate(D-aspartate) O-methyltransferase
MPDFDYLRQRMVREVIAARGISDPRVLDAFLSVPRHLFVQEHLRPQAYGDHALPIGFDQTISQPYIVARMVSMLGVEETHRVLEIGTGSGYQTAILARLSKWVFSIERISELVRQAIQRMRNLKIDNVKIQRFDGSTGWGEMAPFDRIIVAAGAPRAPEPLLAQLAGRGRLLVPEGDLSTQRLVLYRKDLKGRVRRETGEAAAFVPLVGRHGWNSG